MFALAAGMQLMKDRGVNIDMVYSGINLGGNLGTDTLYSGTVSAAVEGNLCGVPAVAVSVNDHMAQHFGFACELALEALENAKWISPDTVLNINTPNLPKEQIKGVKLTSLGRREYKNEFRNPETGDDGRALYSYGGEPVHYDGLPDTIDVVAMQNGYATVTPLHRDLTDYRMQQAVRLILETNEKSYEIAEHVGYEDANYFSYVFKRKYGMSPSKYRTEHIGK